MIHKNKIEKNDNANANDEEEEQKQEKRESSEEDEEEGEDNTLMNYTELCYNESSKLNVEVKMKNNRIYKNNECEDSLFIFNQTNPFRTICIKIVHNSKFENFILVLIGLSTLRLIIDTFFDDPISNRIFDSCDLIFNFFFYLEFILKVVGKGFIMHEGTYLRDNWNKLDFLIVIISMVDLDSIIKNFLDVSKGTDISFLKVLRLMRTLRPLRFISHNVQLKIIVRSLLDSIEPIVNVLLIILIVYFMYGIGGITLFNASYHTCYKYSDLYGYPLAFSNFAELIYNANYTGLNETENANLVIILHNNSLYKFF